MRSFAFARAAMASDRLLMQVVRLHRMAPLPKTRAAVIAWLRSELDEVEREDEGSEAAMFEAGDVLALALHLIVIETQGRPVLAIAAVAAKLRRRLDEVARGSTWAEAKRIVG